MAPSSERSTATIAFVGLTLGAHPEIVPRSVAKMNKLGLLRAASVTTKPAALDTMPVGKLGGAPPGGGGTVTTSACLTPSPSYSVDRPVPLSLTHTGAFGAKTMPHPFTRSASV